MLKRNYRYSHLGFKSRYKSSSVLWNRLSLKGKSSYDMIILTITVILTMIGLIIVYSVTIPFGFSYLKDQLVRIGIGFVALAVASFIPYHYYRRRIKDILLIIAIVFLIFTLITGKKVAGARRWTKAKWLSVQFQPSEFAKYALVIWLAGYFANRQSNEEKTASSIRTNRSDACLQPAFNIDKNPYSRFGYSVKSASSNFLSVNNTSQMRGNRNLVIHKIVYLWRIYRASIIFPFSVVVLTAVLLLLQPAIGTCIIVIFLALIIFFISGVRLRYILFTIILGIIVLIISVNFIPHAKNRYQQHKAGTTYQQIQSKIAIGSGGFRGKGLGEGKQKYYFLPKLHTDFIFSSIGEESGFIGSVLILGLFFVLLNRGLKIAREINDTFGCLLVAGIMVVVFQYVLVHLAVALAIFPVTGQPLPFISYGGSALISNLYAIGVVLNVSKFRRQNIDREVNFRSIRLSWWNRRIGFIWSSKR